MEGRLKQIPKDGVNRFTIDDLVIRFNVMHQVAKLKDNLRW